jgi:galactokinase
VTAGDLATRLADAGLSPDDARAKRELFARALEAFEARTRTSPSDVWWVPGRLEVFGKHTDYCGGHSLVGTVPRGFAVAARARTDGLLRVADARRHEELQLDAGAIHGPGGRTFGGWRNYVAVAARRLALNFPGADLAADIVFASDLPSASGMSSSSGLIVSVSAALVALAGIRERPAWQQAIEGPADEAGYYACVENGMSFGALAGASGVGTHGGSEDHLAIVCGGPRRLAEWGFVPIRAVGTAALPDGWQVIVAASGVAADKTGTAREAYNRLAREAAALLRLWNQQEPPAHSLRAALSSSGGAPDRLREIIGTVPDADDAAALNRRLSHFLREDGRAAAARLAFEARDSRALGELSSASQHDAEALLQNQVPETVALVQLARRLGAFAASSFGAGFGGSVWALVETEAAARLSARWLAEYTQAFPARSRAVTFVAGPGPGLVRVA